MDTPETQITKQGIEAALESVKHFLGKILGPPLEEMGGLIADPIRFYRFKNQIRIIQKAEAFLKAAGISPHKVPLKILAPLLDNGSLEEDDSMIDKWASLLARATDENQTLIVQPSFPEVLKELSTLEARILDGIFDMIIGVPIPREEWRHRGATADSIKQFLHLDDRAFELAIDNLYRLRLLSPPSSGLSFTSNPDRLYQLHTKEIVCLTDFGFVFVSACRPPERNG